MSVIGTSADQSAVFAGVTGRVAPDGGVAPGCFPVVRSRIAFFTRSKYANSSAVRVSPRFDFSISARPRWTSIGGSASAAHAMGATAEMNASPAAHANRTRAGEEERMRRCCFMKVFDG